jgi:hypothetical protein
MEGTGVVSLATAVRHNGLVDGAMPWNRLLCLTLDEPWHSFACGCVLPIVRPGGFGQGALQDVTFGWCGGGANGAARLTGLGVGLAERELGSHDVGVRFGGSEHHWHRVACHRFGGDGKRYEGNGRSDAVRLSTRGNLRRV